MPRNEAGVFSRPTGTRAVPNQTISSQSYNADIDDLAVDANTPRPVTAGGTGAVSAEAARTNLGLDVILEDVVRTDDIEDVVRTDDIADVVRTDDLAASVQTAAIQTGPTTGQNVATTGEGVQARDDGEPSPLPLNPDGGDVTINEQVAWHSGNLPANIVQNHVTLATLFPASSNRQISPLNTTINKRLSGSAIRVRARISMDRQHNSMLYVRRGSIEIGSAPQVGNRLRGMVPIPFDDDENSSMFTINVDYIDATSETGDIQYEFWVRGGSLEMAFNQTRDDDNNVLHERATSQVILEEIILGG